MKAIDFLYDKYGEEAVESALISFGLPIMSNLDSGLQAMWGDVLEALRRDLANEKILEAINHYGDRIVNSVEMAMTNLSLR